MTSTPAFIRGIVNDEQFRGLILGLVVFNALCLALDATPDFAELHGEFLYWIFVVSQIVFVVEIALRLVAHAPRVGGFFRDGWNCFDFTIVAVSLVPAVGSFALVARLLRVVRVLRVLSLSQTLRGSFGSSAGTGSTVMLFVVLLALSAYVFAIGGHYVLGEVAPAEWGSFARSAGSVLGLLALQDVEALARSAYAVSPLLAGYFVAFYAVVAGLVIGFLRALVRSRHRAAPGDGT